MLQPELIRAQFPIFTSHPDLVYLDNAATTQKPALVIDRITDFYQKENANIHRGVYPLAAEATQKYENVRQQVAQWIGAANPQNIVYTSGTTAGINLVAQSFLAPRLKAGDEVMVSHMEHHSNILPWQMICQRAKAHLRVIPILATGELDLAALQNMLSPRTKMLAITHISNTLGTINPLDEIVAMAQQRQIPILVDAAQSIAHYPIKVEELGVDFLVFSGHKLYGPTGTGILYGKQVHLEKMSPIQFGGDMIRKVTWEESTFAHVPQCFEAGTTNIAGIIGLGCAIDFVQSLDQEAIQQHFKQLVDEIPAQLQAISGLRILGQAQQRSPIFSFTLEDVHPHDVATFLGAEQIAVRAGHHCTQPLLEHFGVGSTTRASFTIYNTLAEAQQLVEVLRELQEFFK